MLSREDAPDTMYLVFDLDGDVVESYEDEDEAYLSAGRNERVVTFAKA
jgi:hypothetical protein